MRKFINKIIDRIQKKRAIKNHRKMWHWLAKNPGKSKLNYLLKYGGPLLNDCYLCDYAIRVVEREGGGTRFMCQYCPLDWGGRECNNHHSLYEEWWLEGGSLEDINRKKRTELALQIAELPEKVEK